jgi:hypothetical protein
MIDRLPASSRSAGSLRRLRSLPADQDRRPCRCRRRAAGGAGRAWRRRRARWCRVIRPDGGDEDGKSRSASLPGLFSAARQRSILADASRARPAGARRAASLRPAGQPYGAGRQGLAGQLAALRGARPCRRRHRAAWSRLRPTSCMRMTGRRPDAGLYALRRGGCVPSRHDRAQPRLPGQFGCRIFSQLGLPPQAMASTASNITAASASSRPACRRRCDHDRQPDLCPGNPHAGVRHGARRAEQPAFADLYGIVNGIDLDIWNPAADSPSRWPAYTAKTYRGAWPTRRAVEERSGSTGRRPAVLRRQPPDLAEGHRHSFDHRSISWSPARGWRAGLRRCRAGRRASRRCRCAIPAVSASSSAMTRRCRICCRAAPTVILIPSRFEPCGLTQLYGLRYGCVPIVARTGGLADTDHRRQRGGGGGRRRHRHPVRAPKSAGAFAPRHIEGSALHADRRQSGRTMQKQGMKSDVSWDGSAAKYAELYRTPALGLPE